MADMETRGMIERVALRIWHERAKHFGEPAKPFVKDERWELCLSYARAAIEAMREPTAEMRIAGREEYLSRPLVLWRVEQSYRAMIDAILKEDGQ